jgi:hypothetical protein
VSLELIAGTYSWNNVCLRRRQEKHAAEEQKKLVTDIQL